MGNAKKSVKKGLAVVTLVAGAVALAHALKKNKKAKMLKEAANDAREQVLAHAKRLGGASKRSYEKIVDSVLAEYAGMRAFTKKELDELAGDLKEVAEKSAKKAVRKKKKKR